MGEPKEGLTEVVQVSLPEGMSPEDLTEVLTSYARRNKKTSKKDESVVFKTTEKGPDRELRVSRDTYKGRAYNSIREWYQDGSGTLRPGRGVTFSYENIDDIVEGLNQLKTHLEDHLEGED